MGKNQAYKAMQRTRLGSTSAGPGEIHDSMHSGQRSLDSRSSSSSSESLGSDDEEKESKRSKSRSKRDKKKKHRSRNKNSSGDNEAGGPVPLSRFFESVKS